MKARSPESQVSCSLTTPQGTVGSRRGREGADIREESEDLVSGSCATYWVTLVGQAL